MSDIVKKYESNDFVATDDELKLLLDAAEISIEPKKEPKIENIKSETANPEIDISKAVVIGSKEAHLETDYNYIRNNLYTITERSIDALNTLVDIAQQSQHPRAYEVISMMVNTIASAQKDLMTIHKDKKKLELDSTQSEKSDVVNNNLFIGNTAQLDEIIANMTKKKILE